MAEPLSTYRPQSKRMEAEAYHRAVRYIAGKSGWTIPEVEHVLFMFSEYITDMVMEGKLIEFPHLGCFCARAHKHKKTYSPVELPAFVYFKPNPILRRQVMSATHAPMEVLNRARDYSYPGIGRRNKQVLARRGKEGSRELEAPLQDRSEKDKTVGGSLHRVRKTLHARMLRSNS